MITEDPRAPTSTATTPPTWQRLPDLPLSLRYDELTATVGDRVLVLGGSDRTFSGGPLALPTLRDGATLDLESGTWHKVAMAPWAPSGAVGHVVVGHSVLLARSGSGTWALYDADRDVWSKVPAPPEVIQQPTMAAIGNRVYVLDLYAQESDAPVQTLDLTTMHWSALPASKGKPALDDRSLVAAGNQLVVMASDLYPRQTGKRHQPAVAEIWDGKRWTRFPSQHAAGLVWQWTGSKIMSAYRVTRKHSNHSAAYEFRASEFDPVTHTWTQLPWLPPQRETFFDDGVLAGTGTRAVSQGYLYDDATRTSTAIPPPPGWSSRTGVVTDDAIIVIGGVREKPGTSNGRVSELEISNQAWIRPIG